MKDIELDFENKVLINNLIDKKDRVSQQIKLAVKTSTGDWLLDEDFGVNYSISWGNILSMETYIKQQIQQVDGVSSIREFKIKKQLDNNNRVQFKIDAVIALANDILTFSETI